jgi:sugar phosphate isomerase/epimerase
MQRVLSTYLLVTKKLNRELLTQIHGAGFEAVEIFAARSHFDYVSRDEVRSIAQALSDNHLVPNSLHAPNNRDMTINREGGSPLSVTEIERVRRIEAMDELKRVIDVAENLPYARLILHMGGSRENADPRKRDAAFSSLEHLVLHAKHVGVTLCLENTTSEMGAPAYLRAFIDETRLNGLRFNFDVGHAFLGDGPEEERLLKAFEPMKELIASAHIHDNHGEKDEHLPPYDGMVDWPAALKLLRTVPVSPLPLTLELKEKTGPAAPPIVDQLAAACKSLGRVEEVWSSLQ